MLVIHGPGRPYPSLDATLVASVATTITKVTGFADLNDCSSVAAIAATIAEVASDLNAPPVATIATAIA
jgi:hypothetical protein